MSAPGERPPDFPAEDRIGLCAACLHATRLTSAKGSRFFRCDRSFGDPRYPRFPTLPTLACAGFETTGAEETDGSTFHP